MYYDNILYKMQVLLHVSDYATIAIYSISALVVAVIALILPIETRGRSLTVSAGNTIHYWEGNMGKYSARGWHYWPN